MDTWEKVAKDHGVIGVAKLLVSDQTAHGLDEQTHTRLVTAHAQKLFPSDREDVAFSKLYTANSNDAVLLRKAAQVVKAAGFASGPYPLPT